MIQRTSQPLNPWQLLDEMMNQVPIAPGEPSPAARHFPVDVLEADDHLIVRFNLPGVRAESVDVSLENNTLALSARLEEDGPDGARFLYRERPAGVVRRTVSLPVRLNPEQTQASLENGVLTVRVSKAPEATARKITVRASGQPQAIAG